MARGRRWVVAAVAVVVLALVAGRWISVFLADRWWAQSISPAAGSFITNLHLLRLSLDTAAVLIAVAWCVGNFLLVYRAVGSVHIARSVANIEFREALTPGAMLAITVAAGAILGLVLGLGLSEDWATVALAWRGVTYGVSDPVLGRDLGVYVAQLPGWRLAQEFTSLLVVAALIAILVLYILIGAVRWMDRRPAISDHARSHLGLLLATSALCLVWGYLLEPMVLVAGGESASIAGQFRAHELLSQLLAGAALTAAAVSVLWSVRPRHGLMLAGWLILGGTALLGHYVVPLLPPSGSEPVVDAAALRRLEGIAFGMQGLDEQMPGPPSRPASAVGPPSLWQRRSLTGIIEADSFQLLSAYPAVIGPRSAAPRPVWLGTRVRADTSASLVAIADDRTTDGGGVISFRLGDTLGYPGVVSYLDLPASGLRPGAAGAEIGPIGRGVRIGGWNRRLPLAWALQVGSLLGPVSPAFHIDWHLSPTDRLTHLAPFAAWGPPMAAVSGGEVYWIATGYLRSETFPLVERLSWHGLRIGAAQAALIGVVAASGAETRIFLRRDGDPLAEAWRAISGGLLEKSAGLPRALAAALPYPDELFDLQAQVVGRTHWAVGDLSDRPDVDDALAFRPALAWTSDSVTAGLMAVYENPEKRETSAVLLGRPRNLSLELELVRLDSLPPLPLPSSLRTRWSRFPSFEQLGDSVRESGSRLDEGAVSFRLTRGGLEAYQPFYASRPGARGSLVWIAVAHGNRLGAGRNWPEAWLNLRGTLAPVPPGSKTGPDPLREARGWMQLADSALRAGDWAQFGRAFDALRELLGGGRESRP